MGEIVVFDAAAFVEAYPQFSVLTEAQLNNAFDVACLILDNTASSPVPYNPDKGVMVRKVLLWLLVCHLATLALRPATQAGALTNATEGSVSVGFTLPQSGLNAAYFNQSPCGQTFWQAVRPYLVGVKYYKSCNYHPWG